MEIKGTIVQTLGLMKGTSKAGNPWAKAELVIETEGEYPKKVKLSNMKNAESFALLPVGVAGTFHIELESREYNGRWYTEVNCWKWEMPHEIPAEIKAENAKMTSNDEKLPDVSEYITGEMKKTPKQEDSEEDEELPF